MIMHSPPAAPAWPPPPPSPKRKPLPGVAIAGIVLASLLVMCGLAVVVVGLFSAGQDRAPVVADEPAQPPSWPPSAAPSVTDTGSPSVHLTTKAAPAPPPAPVKVVIDDGTWTIGEDYPAGTYRADDTPGTCYWEIDKSGTNGADIITNGIGPGNLRVTLKKGQDFHTQGCGIWTKQ